ARLFGDLDQRHQYTAVLDKVAAIGHLDLADVDFLEARNQRQRHRLELRTAGAEHEHGHRLIGGEARIFFRINRIEHTRRHVRADRMGDAVWIDDHDDRTIAENGGAREHRDVAQACGHRLYDDLLGVEHTVHDDAEHLSADLRHDDKARTLVGL